MTRNPFEVPNYLGNDKDNTIKKKKIDEWEEELVETDTSEPKTIASLFDYKRLKWLYLILGVLLFVIIVRLFSLQIIASSYYKEVAEENRYRVNVIRAPRGVIYDQDKDLLVKNIPSFDVVAIPADIPNDPAEELRMWNKLKEIIEINDEEINNIKNKINSLSYESVPIKENIDKNLALIIETSNEELPGINIEKNPNRDYQEAEYFSHIIGYTGKINDEEYSNLKNQSYSLNDKIGKGGIEEYYEQSLRGKNGRKQVEVDSLGKVKKTIATEEPTPGADLVLSIDKDFQIATHNILKEGAREAGSGKAVALAMNPQTGEILSLVSLPTFDNNLFANGISAEDYTQLIEDTDEPLFNRAISGKYPPGSTVKPIVGAKALDESVVTTSTIIVDKGSIDVPNKYNPDIIYHFIGWETTGLGAMDIYSAIAMSSDIYFYVVAGGFEQQEGMGTQRLIGNYKDFGIGEVLGIDLPFESKGFVPSPEWKQETKGEEWYLGDDYNIGIGQGDLLATPLQVAEFTSAVANGGILYKPHIVKKIIDNSEDLIKIVEPQVIRKDIVSSDSINIAKEAMRRTVTDGTAKALNIDNLAIAGKTGTSQYGTEDKTHAWFTCFAPYDNPEIVVTVLVEGGGEGSKTAVPIAGDILEAYFTHKQE